jgi:preprotein translocase subunit SecG
MQTFVMILHILACLALILIVLLQTGRGAEMGAAFGGASQTLFGGGGGGATFLGKLTTAAAVVFMLTCLGLSYFAAGPQTRSIMENVPVQKPEGPALPEAKPIEPATGQAPTATVPANTQESGAATEPALPKLPEPVREGAQPPAPASQEKASAPAPEGKPPAAPKP